MTRTITVAPVRKSVRVSAAPARAFEVFTTGFARWWPRAHSVNSSPMKDVQIEPRVGGRWFERGEDGYLAHWDPACSTFIIERLVKKLFSLGEPDPAEIRKGEERFHRCAAVLEAHLEGRRYVTGDTLTVADFSIGAPLNLAQAAGIPLAQYRQITRWHADLCELPSWRKTLDSSQPSRAH